MFSIEPRGDLRYATGVSDAMNRRRSDASAASDADFDGVVNFRDLGGLATTDGGSVAYGRLFRSAALHDASDHDVATLRARGITLNIDLRDPGEIDYTGRGALEFATIGFANRSLSFDRLMERPPDPDAPLAPLASRYRDYLDQGPRSMVAAVESIADTSNHAVLVNCFFGKDRTGVLIALVLEAIGVERDAIVADYARSAAPVQVMVARLAHDPVYAETIARTDPSRLAAEPDTMVDFLETLDRRDGGALGWLTRAGLSARTLAQLRTALLEGPVSPQD